MRTRQAPLCSAKDKGRFNPCVLAGGRDTLSGLSFCRGSCFNPRALTISQSRNLAISQSRNNGLLAASGRGAESQNNGENPPDGDRNQRFAVGVRQEEASQCKNNAHAFFRLNAAPRDIGPNGINSIRDFRERRMRCCRVTSFSGLFDIVKKPCGEIVLTGIRHQCDNPFSCVFRSACHRQRREKSCAG